MPHAPSKLDEEKVQEILIESLEELLDQEAPDEADSAALYVKHPEQFQTGRSDERAFGIPGGGFAMLVGPLLMCWVVEVAKWFLEELAKKGTQTIAVSTFTYLKRKVFGPPNEVKRKEETILAITAALVKAGWNAKKAGATAEKVWQTGIQTGQRLAAGEG